MLINSEEIKTYWRAMGGAWGNPLDPSKAPFISVDISRVYDETDAEGVTVTKELAGVTRRAIPYDKNAVIDPSAYGMPLPPITHEVLYAYIKALTLQAMEKPEAPAPLPAPPTPTVPKFPPGWPGTEG